MTTHQKIKSQKTARKKNTPKVAISVHRDLDLWTTEDSKTVRKAIRKTFTCFAHTIWPKLQTIEVSILLTSDPTIQALNSKWRSKNQPTNVLAFPSHDNQVQDHMVGFPFLAGDIVASYQTIKQEAEELNIPFHDHLSQMVIHASLHLMGFNHLNNDDAIQMEEFETMVLEQLHITHPWREYAV